MPKWDVFFTAMVYNEMYKNDAKGIPMYQTVAYENLRGNYLLIDVRSPGEYDYATIPGAVSLPIFDDEQRSRIGQVYVNESVEKAKKIGIQAVSERLPHLYEQIADWNKTYDKLVFFCAKGGMRSASLTALMVELGISAIKLKDGYKGYRALINARLPEVNKGIRYIVLHGKTGTGKTRLLHELKERGFPTLDLEQAANHRGSLLGSVGLGAENSQKQFESLVYESLSLLQNAFVFVEGESKRIGKIIIPHYIFESMNQGTHLLIDASLTFRTEALIEEYTTAPDFKSEMSKSIEKMVKYIGDKKAKLYCDLIEHEDYEKAAMDLMVNYYDPLYENEFDKHEFNQTFQIDNVVQGAKAIEAWFKKWENHQEQNQGVRDEAT